ncbi:hypothetical protein Tco_0157497 [Tanacetum coccineum]
MYAITSTRPDIAYAMDHTYTTGWVFLLGGGAISWASKKQTCITDSTMEAEFVALAAAGKDAKWLRNLIYEIPLWPKPISPISIHCDNAATLAKAYCQIYNGKSRHLGARIKGLPMRWQKKMHFLLATLKVVYVLRTLMPEFMEDEMMQVGE